MKCFCTAAVCLVWSSLVYGQLINNKSIEGVSRPNQPPSFWYPCSPESTPDTQPGIYGVELAAHDGQTYLSLVTRTLETAPYEVKEDVETRLNLPLTGGFPYLLNISLAWSPNMRYEESGQIVPVAQHLKLRVYGGLVSCERMELLWESPEITYDGWYHFEQIIRPGTDGLRYLILEAYPAGDTYQNGNILIDNINLREEPVEIPTAFTPNGDGVNDEFVINGLRPSSKLLVVNRDGQQVFSSENYQNNWKGEGVPSGVYFYTLTTTIRPQKWKGELSIMR